MRLSKTNFSGFHVWGSSVILTAAAVLIAAIASKSEFNATDYFAWHNDWRLLIGCLNTATTGQCIGISKFPLSYLVNSVWSVGAQGNLVLTNLFALLIPVLALGFVQGWRMAIVASSVVLSGVGI